MSVTNLSALPALYAGQGRVRQIIDGVLPVGVTLLYGPSGVGKTGLAVATTMAVAAGRPWAGRAVERGPVLYVAAENHMGVRDRLHAAACIAGSHQLAVTIADREEATTLSQPNGHAAIERAVEGAAYGSPRLIVIDTLATAFGSGSQDDSGPATTFMNNMEALSAKYECAVLVVHHTAMDSK